MGDQLSALAKVLPAFRLQLRFSSARVHEKNAFTPGNNADLGDLNTRNGGWQRLLGRSCEEKLVVIAAMQSEVESGSSIFVRVRPDGQGRAEDFRSDSGLIANVPEIGREAITQVDHGGGQLLLAQGPANFDARLRKEVTWVILRR